MEKIMDKIIKAEIYLLVFFLPLFFLPVTSDFFSFPKNMLLISGVLLTTLTWLIKMVLTKKVSLKRSFFDLPLILVCAAFVISGLLTPFINKYEEFLFAGGPSTIISLTLLYFLITNNFDKDKLPTLVLSLTGSAVILALSSLVIGLGLTASLPIDQIFKEKLFSPAGGYLNLSVFLFIMTIWQMLFTYRLFTSRHDQKLLLAINFGLLLILTAGLVNAGYVLFNTIKPVFLALPIGWQIAIESLKNFPLFGVGSHNFLSAFNQYRPIFYNTTNQWNMSFDASSNYVFHLWTTVGTVGLAAFLFLLYRILTRVRLLNKNLENDNLLLIVLLVITGLFLILPAGLLLLFTFYFFLALFSLHLPQKEYAEQSRILPWTLLIPSLIIFGGVFYLLYRGFGAELQFKKSLDAYAQNDGAATYNSQIQAITLNPNRPAYRLAYSQTNLALAQNIAAKKDLTDQDRQNISVLIQQAIAEAKAATALEPQNSLYWQNLAQIYRNLINFAQGADQWTIAAYQQTIAVEPTNPFLRINLGGVYYGLQKWDEAIRLFQEATFLKPDYANGHYNLAAAYREKGDYEKAAAEMQTVLNLIPSGSDDWNKASKELEDLQAKLKETTQKQTKTSSGSLKTPEPLPSGIKPPLTLPTSSAPEISPAPAEASPSPTATP